MRSEIKETLSALNRIAESGSTLTLTDFKVLSEFLEFFFHVGVSEMLPTRENLGIIERAVARGEKAYEVTQLMNSLLGLLVFPQQRYMNSIPETPLSELVDKGWPCIKTTFGEFPENNLKQLLRMLRNSIAHFNVEFLTETEERITGLRVHDSVHNENSIDLVLFLNGVPVASVELKSEFTQSIEAAVEQYKSDRHPQPKGQAAEPLLRFPQGALIHFAVSNDEVRMTTRLAGPETESLPFNQGNNGGSGNPPNPNGHPTAYLWEQVWERESWLEILGRYMVYQRDGKRQIKKAIFPRYHQLDATRKLQAAVLADGPGTKYLIQHSAGSGKTNSIAWTAHFLAELHDANHKKVFDSVLVISDRRASCGQRGWDHYDHRRQTL